jgi:HSP20 family molecular chaperone IbpA
MTDKQVATRTQSAPAMIPNVDVVEDDAGITISADLPGVPKDKLLLRIEGESLQIEGELVSDAPEGMEAIYAEVRLPRYRRAFTLSRELDTEKINASMKDGVLNLRIPKAEHAQPRRIEVKAA